LFNIEKKIGFVAFFMKICGWLVLVTKLILEKSKNDPAISLRIKNTNLPNPNFFS